MKKVFLVISLIFALFFDFLFAQSKQVNTIQNLTKDQIFSYTCDDTVNTEIYSGHYGIYLWYLRNRGVNDAYIWENRVINSGNYLLYNNTINGSDNGVVVFNRPFLTAGSRNWRVLPWETVRYLTTAEEIWTPASFQFWNWLWNPNIPKVISYPGVASRNFSNPNYRNVGNSGIPRTFANPDTQLRHVALVDSDNNKSTTSDNTFVIGCNNVVVRWCGDGIISNATTVAWVYDENGNNSTTNGRETCDDGANNGQPGRCNTTCNGMVPLPTPAPTCTISVNPSTINAGGSTTLTWSTTNASSVTSSQFTANGLNGSVTLSPNTTTTYTANVVGTNGQTVACTSTTVTVNPLITNPSCTFSPSSVSVSQGQSATLNYQTQNALNGAFSMNPVIGFNPSSFSNLGTTPNGTITTSTFTTPGVYQWSFTVNGQPGSTSSVCGVTVNVAAIGAPLCTLTALPSTIYSGQNIALTWTTQGAASLTSNFGTTLLNGSTSILASSNGTTGTRTFQITPTNGITSSTCSATVQILPLLPMVCPQTSMSATGIFIGQSATVTWSGMTNVSSALINANPAINPPFSYAIPGAQIVSGGSLTFTPSATGNYNFTIDLIAALNTTPVTLTCPLSWLVVMPPLPIDLGISKIFTGVTPRQSGDTVTFILNYGNFGLGTVTGNVIVTDELPVGVTYLTASMAPVVNWQFLTWSGFFNTVWTWGLTGQIILTGIINGSGLFTGQINTGSISIVSWETFISNNTGTASIPFFGIPDVWINKQFTGLIPQFTGDLITFILNYGNSGNTLTTGVVITDQLPLGIDYLTASIAPVVSWQTVLWSGLMLNPGQTGQIILTGRINSGMINGAVNFASLTTTTSGELNLLNNVSSVVVPYIQLSFTKTLLTTGQLISWSTVAFRLTLTNSGIQLPVPFSIQDLLPSQVTFVSSSFPMTVVGNTYTANLPIPVPSLFTFWITLTGILNTSNISGVINTGIFNAAISWQSVVRTGIASFDILQIGVGLTKTAQPMVARIGELVGFAIRYVNSGTIALSGVTIVDTFPPTMTFVSQSSTPNLWAPIVSWGLYTWTVNQLPVGGSWVIYLTWRVDR